MKDGYGDNYYMQMIGNIRRYKGTAPLQKTGTVRKTILIPHAFAQWDDVQPVYWDYTNDIVHRDAAGYGDLIYKNTTGLNDFERMKTAFDENNVYFYVQTVRPLQQVNSENRMTLYLRLPHNTANSTWNGYHAVLNRTGGDTEHIVLEQCVGGWNWEKSGKVSYRMEGNQMHIAVPRAWLGLKDKPVALEFKWSDTATMDGGITPFYNDGDAAPIGRVNYVFDGSP